MNQASDPAREAQASPRPFVSALLISFSPFPLAMGWLIFASGGAYYVILGLSMVVAGLALRPSSWRLAFAAVALVVGCAPITFLLL